MASLSAADDPKIDRLWPWPLSVLSPWPLRDAILSEESQALFEESQQLLGSDPKAQDPKGTQGAEDPKGTGKRKAEDPKAEDPQGTNNTESPATKRQAMFALWEARCHALSNQQEENLRLAQAILSQNEENQRLAQALFVAGPFGTEDPKGTGKRKAEDPKAEDPQGTNNTESPATKRQAMVALWEAQCHALSNQREENLRLAQALLDSRSWALKAQDPKGTHGVEDLKGTVKCSAGDPKAEDPQGTGGTEAEEALAFFEESQQLFNSDPKAQDPKGTCPAEDPKGTAKCKAKDPKDEDAQGISSTEPPITICYRPQVWRCPWKAHRASGLEVPL